MVADMIVQVVDRGADIEWLGIPQVGLYRHIVAVIVEVVGEGGVYPVDRTAGYDGETS